MTCGSCAKRLGRLSVGTVPSDRDFEGLLASAAEVVTIPPQATREAAYEAAGVCGLDHADLVIAVWNGQPSQGRGGTADIVSRARVRHMRLVWVYAGSSGSGTLDPTLQCGEQGEVRLENWLEVL